MGWSYYDKPSNVRQDLIDQTNWEKDGTKCKVLDIAIVALKTAYLAVHYSSPTEDRVMAFVYLLNYTRDRHYNFGIKTMTECMGPCEDDCPERILKLLTPLTEGDDPSGWAAGWRERCYANLAVRKGRTAKRKVGTKLKSIDPEGVKIGDARCTTAEVVMVGKTLALDVGWNVYRMKDWVIDQMEVDHG